MFAVFLSLFLGLTNYQYTRVENVRKCVSENSNSDYCKARIEDLNKSIKAMEAAEIPESSSGG